MASKKKIRNYSVEDMQNALEAVKRGLPVAAASRQFNIPRITLLYKSKGKYPVDARMGPQTVLTEEEEQHLVNWLLKIAELGFPATKQLLLDSVQMLVNKMKRPNTFTNGRPGRKWYKSFMIRHPQISERLTQNLTKCRSDLTEDKIRAWFVEIADYLTATNANNILQDPRRIYNADETAFFLAPKGVKCLIRKGDKTAYNFIGNDEKECLTCLMTANASGDVLPPMIVYSYERIPSHIANNMPKEWAIGKSESGWMTGQTFFEYIANIFHPWLIKNEVPLPVLIFVDGHASHLTMELSNFCIENSIILVALYPNATHILQPMDVGLFHPLKAAWKKGVHNYKIENDGQKLKREYFAPLLKRVIDQTITKQMIQSAFRTCGLYPFDSNAINYAKYFKGGQHNKDITADQSVQSINSNMTSAREFLKVFEHKLGNENLNRFQAETAEEWSGATEDKNLFLFWREISNTVDMVNDQQNLEVSLQENDIDNSVLQEVDNDLDLAAHSAQNVNEITPEKEKEPIQEQLCDSSVSLENVPTPFKKYLFWPKATVSSKPKRLKEKIPSVATSNTWKDYHLKKQQKKEQAEQAKAERKRLREKKKEEVQKKKTSKRKHNEDTSDSSISITLESEGEGDEDFSYMYKVGDHVIVRYGNDYFPGKLCLFNVGGTHPLFSLYVVGRILEIDSSEYFVTAMTPSGSFDWKWAEPDEMWYTNDDVVQLIKKPHTKSASREIYTVPEMRKFKNFSS